MAEVNFDILQPPASHSVSHSCTGSSHFFSSIWNLDSAPASLPATGRGGGGMCASIWQLWQIIYYINDLCMNDSPLRISRDILRNRCRDKAKTLSLFSHSIIYMCVEKWRKPNKSRFRRRFTQRNNWPNPFSVTFTVSQSHSFTPCGASWKQSGTTQKFHPFLFFCLKQPNPVWSSMRFCQRVSCPLWHHKKWGV